MLNAVSSNYGSMFVLLAPFHDRQDGSLSGEAIAAQLRARVGREVPEARVLVFGPPAVRGLGNASGFKLMVEATAEVDFDELQAQADNLAAKGNQHRPGSSACSMASAPARPRSTWILTELKSRR